MFTLRNFLILSCAALSTTLYGQSKISPAGHLILKDYTALQNEGKSLLSESGTAPSYPAIVMLDNSDEAKQAIMQLGIDIISDLGDIVTIDLPVDQAETISRLPGVKYVEFGQKMDLMMDYARPASTVTEAQEGFTLDGENLKFDGTGVIAGMMDTGFQASHVNFKNDGGTGSSRIQRLFWYRGNGGNPTTYNASNIGTFTTDNQGESHATHVAGIMAGSYNSTGTFASVSSANGGSATRVNGNIPYYGIATGADLACAVGALYTANITGGVEHIVDYAKQTGQPCVVNLSLGSTSGPHDGTDAYSQTLSRLGKDAIICIAAGNDGDINMSIVKELTETDPNLQTMIANNRAEGVVDIWGNDNSTFTVKWAIFNTANRTITPLITISGANQSFAISSSSNQTFGRAFNGSIEAVSQVNPLNNRFNVYSSVNVTPLSNTSTSRLALIVEGRDGQKVWVYGNSNTTFASNSLVGWTAGNAENSINDAACAENLISVGAYTTRTTWGVLVNNNVNVYQYTAAGGFTLGRISPFSSYGASFQGKQLPLVCAPGANIVSSFSRFYVNSQNLTNSMSANARVGIATDYWGPMQGTSMACPYVAGVVALWLQACPTLTAEQVIDVINNSSVYNSLTMRADKDRWGAGKIDAVAGLKYVLQNYSAIGSVWEDDAQRFILTPAADGYDVTLAGEARFTVSLTDMQGRTVATAEGFDGAAAVSTAALTQGIYVLTVQSPSTRLSRKIAVR